MVDSVQRFGCPPHCTENLPKMVPTPVTECQVTKDKAKQGWFVNNDCKRVRLVVELVFDMLIMITML